MTFGTAKAFKTGEYKGRIKLGIIIPADVVENEGLMPGSKVQFDMSKLKNIEPKPPIYGQHLKKQNQEENPKEEIKKAIIEEIGV